MAARSIPGRSWRPLLMFSKKPEPSQPSPAQRSPLKSVASGGSTFSVLGADVTITGNVEASADLHVHGTVQGDLSCTALVQRESSLIEGAVVAASTRTTGAVQGTITARELVPLKSPCIDGYLHYDTLTIEKGTKVNGRFAPAATGTPSEPARSPAPVLGLTTVE